MLWTLAAGRPPAHPVVEALHARWPRSRRCARGSKPRSTPASASSSAGRRPIWPRSSSSSGPAAGEITLAPLELLGATGAAARAAGRDSAWRSAWSGCCRRCRPTCAREPDAVARARCSPGTADPRARAWQQTGRTAAALRPGRRRPGGARRARICERRAGTGTRCRTRRCRRSCRRAAGRLSAAPRPRRPRPARARGHAPGPPGAARAPRPLRSSGATDPAPFSQVTSAPCSGPC